MAASTGEEEDLQYPPTLDGKVKKLEKELEQFKGDNIYKLFFAMNKKAAEIADSLNETTLRLKDEDKSFDRFLKLIEKLEPLVKTLAALRQDYLKIPEDEVAEQEKKGIPPIERRAASKKK